jgi:flagellar biosynthetic protein FliR
VVALVVHELVVGLILGGIMRLITMAAAIAGSVIAFQAGLSVAQTADPTQGGVQGAVIGNFLGMLGVALIFATNLHHVALYAIRDSYEIFSPTDPLMFGDAAEMALNSAAGAFIVGVQMSAPFIVLGLVFYLGMGILGRMMPQLQVFFVAMPVTIIAGMVLLALLLTMMMGWYLTHYDAQLALLRGS